MTNLFSKVINFMVQKISLCLNKIPSKVINIHNNGALTNIIMQQMDTIVECSNPICVCVSVCVCVCVCVCDVALTLESNKFDKTENVPIQIPLRFMISLNTITECSESNIIRCKRCNCSGWSRISSRRGCQLRRGTLTYDFAKISQKNCMKLKKFWPGEGPSCPS